MARPPDNAPRRAGPRPLTKLPPPPRGMTKEQAAHYRRMGGLMVAAGTLAATDLPMLEAAARVAATLDAMYADSDSSRATIAAFERLHKEQLVQLGMTSAARRAVQSLGSADDQQSNRIKELLG